MPGPWPPAAHSLQHATPLGNRDSIARGVENMVSRRALMLVALFCVAAGTGCPAISTAQAESTATAPSGWRRTADGWEKAETWRRPLRATQPTGAARLHPAAVAVLEVALALASLFILGRKKVEHG